MSRPVSLAFLVFIVMLALPSAGSAQAAVQRYDFQPESGRLETGYTRVVPADAYDPQAGYGFTSPPSEGVNGARHAWNIYGRRVRVDDALPASALSDATRDNVAGEEAFTFRTDVPPGQYDVTLWLGDVTRPTYLVTARVNGEIIEVSRLDVIIFRGRFDVTTLPDGRTPGIGNAVPRTVRVDASEGVIEVTVGPGSERGPIKWDYLLDECPSVPDPEQRTTDLVPEFTLAGLQAMTLHPAADQPLKRGDDGKLTIAGAPHADALQEAVDLFNQGDMKGAQSAFEALDEPSLRTARAAGLFWIAGHPATIDGERELMARSITLLEQVLAEAPRNFAAADLLLMVQLADDAERYRSLYGYGGTPASENMGRANAIVEQFQPDHPYYLKGQILWLRNRGGLDPRRCTASWERAQWLARQLESSWGAVNPYVHLYATDEWENDGRPWTFIDWGALAGPGPEWARVLVSSLSGWLDLFEWWTIHRQQPSGEIGGGWTDDVEIVPAFGLTAYVLEDASHLSEYATIKFTDGIWNSRIVDSDRGYQVQYADVEHTAEPTGNSLHMYPMLRYGDPEGMERIMKSGKTFADLFLTTTPAGHTHFAGNHMSATEIARDPNHRGDIPLNGRVTQPFPFLVWYSSNPGMEEPLRKWAESWVADAARTDQGKPAGIFPQFIWVPTDEPVYPDGTTPWYAANAAYGQYSAFPGYQYYPYNLAALFYLRTREEQFREPFDALQRCAMEWVAAGRPSGDAPTPGQECAWAGGKLAPIAGSTLFEVARATGSSDWDRFLQRFAGSYARFYMNPSEQSLLADQMDEMAATLKATWPYRTTEGLMTDRILVPGWFNVVAYYLGANVPSFFYGLPVQAVTWTGTGRLFAAAVTEATTTDLAVSTYLFADEAREVTLKPWGLEQDGEYVLEAGPATDIAAPPETIEQTFSFKLERKDEGVSLTLSGRTVYAVRIRQTQAGSPVAELMPDPGLGPRDVSYNRRQGGLVVRVHNIGAAEAVSVTVHVHDGPDESGPLIGTAIIPVIAAPNDLVPKWQEVRISYLPPGLPREITVVLDPDERIPEVTEANNVATAVIGGAAPDYPPPMLLSIEPSTVLPGGEVRLTGRNFRAGIVALESESPSRRLTATLKDEDELIVAVDPSTPDATYLVSVRNPDGLQSNLLPLTVSREPRTPTPTPTVRPARQVIYLPMLAQE